VPLYEYQCPNHGRFELIRKFSDPPVEACPDCGAPVEKLLASPAIQFKGTGWYITDYARKGNGGAAKGGSSETKPEGKTDSKPASSDSSSGSSSTPSSSSKTS
jgi:putative FmdB family regulatory protein